MTPPLELNDFRGIWVLREGGFARVLFKNSRDYWVGHHIINTTKYGWICVDRLRAWDSKGDHPRNREWDLMIRKRGDEPKVLFQGTWKDWPIL